MPARVLRSDTRSACAHKANLASPTPAQPTGLSFPTTSTPSLPPSNQLNKPAGTLPRAAANPRHLRASEPSCSGSRGACARTGYGTSATQRAHRHPQAAATSSAEAGPISRSAPRRNDNHPPTSKPPQNAARTSHDRRHRDANFQAAVSGANRSRRSSYGPVTDAQSFSELLPRSGDQGHHERYDPDDQRPLHDRAHRGHLRDFATSRVWLIQQAAHDLRRQPRTRGQILDLHARPWGVQLPRPRDQHRDPDSRQPRSAPLTGVQDRHKSVPLPRPGQHSTADRVRQPKGCSGEAGGVHAQTRRPQLPRPHLQQRRGRDPAIDRGPRDQPRLTSIRGRLQSLSIAVIRNQAGLTLNPRLRCRPHRMASEITTPSPP